MKSDSRLNSCYRRLVFGMSLSDVVSSSVFTLCMVPRTTQLACSIQGFLFHIGVTTTPMYNASLCIYYVISIFFERPEYWIKKRVEPFLHLIPICWNVFAAIFLIASGCINDVGPICWVGSKPLDCMEDPNIECERGAKAAQYRYIFVGYQTFINFFIIIIAMIMLCVKVAKQERKMSETVAIGRLSDATASEDSLTNHRQKSITLEAYRNPPRNRTSERKVVKQAAVFVAAYFFPFLFPSVHYFYKSFAGRRSFALWITMSFFMPLQGFFNAIVFIRPRVIKLRQKNPDLSFSKLLLVTLKIVDLQKFTSTSSALSV